MSPLSPEEILAREILTEEGLVGSVHGAQWVVAAAGGFQFAFSSEDVEEVVKMAALTSVPRTPDWLPGIFLYRGHVTPVLHLGHWLGVSSTIDKSRERIIVNRSGAHRVGFWVDNIVQIASLDAEVEPDVDELGNTSLRRLVRGKIPSSNGPIFLLECSKISETGIVGLQT